jgi:hypothetical protein
MKFIPQSLMRFAGVSILAIATLSLGLVCRAEAQNSAITINKIDLSLVETPQYAASSATVGANPPPASSPSRPGKWVQVDYSFDVNSADRDWLNDVEFRAYVEVDDMAGLKDREGPPALLTAQTTFSIVPNGKDYHGTFFIHPTVVQRFGGEQLFNAAAFASKRNIHIDAYLDGQIVASKDKHDDDPNWIGAMKKINGFLMPRELSPWALINIDRYPPVKLRQAGAQ